MGNKGSKKKNQKPYESIGRMVMTNKDEKIELNEIDYEQISTQTGLYNQDIKSLFDDFIKENPS